MSTGNVGLLIESGFKIFFLICKLLIINLERVVFPEPSSPFKNKMSPTLRLLVNFRASDSISEISKI